VAVVTILWSAGLWQLAAPDARSGKVEASFPKRSCSDKEDHDPAGHRVMIRSNN
jgi:hypothetical protein